MRPWLVAFDEAALSTGGEILAAHRDSAYG